MILKKLNSICFVFIMLAICCEKEIKIHIDLFKHKPVINCILDTDTIVSVTVSQSTPMGDTLSASIDDALVILYMDNQIIDTLINIGKGKYSSFNKRPLPGHSYMINASIPGFENVLVQDSIPELVSLNDAYYIFPAGNDVAGDPYLEFVINFDDNGRINNYYEAVFYAKTNSLVNFFTHDSITYINKFTNFLSNDAVLIDEGDIDYHPVTIFFSDRMFNGKNVTIRAKAFNFGYGYNFGQIGSPGKYKIVEFRSISYAYYQYRKFWTRHLFNQGISLDVRDSEELRDFLFTGEPVNMYTNVKNGYGIFAGYSKSSFVMNEMKK